MKKNFWNPLLSSIYNKTCIPFIGQETPLQWIHLDEIARYWSKEYDYPLEDSNELSHVAQFYAITSGRDVIPKNELSEMLKKIEPPDFSLDNYRNTPYSVLAELKLPIYITTNYDHFMEAALISRGRQPISDFCRWNEHLLKDAIYTDLVGNFRKVNFSFSETKLSSILDQAIDYKPTEDRPLVYHLYGDMTAPESMVLTERDYFDFVINLQSHQDRISLPSFVLNSLARSSLIFIGYRLINIDISFRVIFQGFISLQKTNYRPITIAVQLPPPLKQSDKTEQIKEYLVSYTEHIFDVNIEWGDIEQFVTDLYTRWTQYRTAKQP